MHANYGRMKSPAVEATAMKNNINPIRRPGTVNAQERALKVTRIRLKGII